MFLRPLVAAKSDESPMKGIDMDVWKCMSDIAQKES